MHATLGVQVQLTCTYVLVKKQWVKLKENAIEIIVIIMDCTTMLIVFLLLCFSNLQARFLNVNDNIIFHVIN